MQVFGSSVSKPASFDFEMKSISAQSHILFFFLNLCGLHLICLGGLAGGFGLKSLDYLYLMRLAGPSQESLIIRMQ